MCVSKQHLTRLLLAMLFVLAPTACDDDATRVLAPAWEQGQDVEFEVIAEVREADLFTSVRPDYVVIRSELEWDEFWYKRVHLSLPPRPPPPIDFDRLMVVAALTGTLPSGGFSIRIERIVQTEDERIVQVVSTVPGATCLVSAVHTAPATAASLQRDSRPVVFVKAVEIYECDSGTGH